MRLKVVGGVIAVFSFVLVGLTVVGLSGVADAATFYCRGVEATIVGTAKADVLIGTSGADVIVGLGGADRIKGRGGADLICAGAGPDIVWGQGGSDTIYLGPGNDVAYGGPGNDRIYGGDGKDVLNGDDGADRLHGEKGKDRLNGGAGADILRGNKGSDTLVGQAGPDELIGFAGADYLMGGGGIDSAVGGSGLDSCFAESTSGCEPTVLAESFSSVGYNGCDSDSNDWEGVLGNINGLQYVDTLRCESDDVGNQGYLEYDLGGDYLTFKAAVGLDDYSKTTASVYRMRVYGDDVLLKSIDVGFGEVVTLTADVKDVLVLKIEATKVGGPDDQNSSPDWGTALVSANRNTAVPSPVPVTPLNSAKLAIDVKEVNRDGCDAIWNDWVVAPASVNGTIYSDSLQCQADDVGDGGYQEFVLSRVYQTLTTIVGQRDDSTSTSDTWQFNFYADGELKQSIDVGFGVAVPVSFDVDGALRMRVSVEKIAGPDTMNSRPVFGGPLLTP